MRSGMQKLMLTKVWIFFPDGLPVRGPNGELLGADGKPLQSENNNEDLAGNGQIAKTLELKSYSNVAQDRSQNDKTGSPAEIVSGTQNTDIAENDHFGGFNFTKEYHGNFQFFRFF